MATPPRITAAERDAALARIASRHDRIDDPRRSELGTEPRDAISYVLNRGAAGVPRWVTAADAQDALVLSTWCWWEDRRTERRLLRQGLHLGLTLAELGAPLGLTTRQGLRDRLDRLDALLEFDRPDEQLTRASRRAARARDARQDWINLHREEIRTVLAALSAQARRVAQQLPGESGAEDPIAEAESLEVGDEDRTGHETAEAESWLDELDADYRDDELTPATFAVLGLAVAELRERLAEHPLDPRHRLYAALRAADELRARLAAI